MRILETFGHSIDSRRLCLFVASVIPLTRETMSLLETICAISKESEMQPFIGILYPSPYYFLKPEHAFAYSSKAFQFKQLVGSHGDLTFALIEFEKADLALSASDIFRIVEESATIGEVVLGLRQSWGRGFNGSQACIEAEMRKRTGRVHYVDNSRDKRSKVELHNSVIRGRISVAREIAGYASSWLANKYALTGWPNGHYRLKLRCEDGKKEQDYFYLTDGLFRSIPSNVAEFEVCERI